MRRKHWFLSILLFSVSLSFLLFSKYFFSPARIADSTNYLPATQTATNNVVLLANQDYYPFLKDRFQKARKSIIGTIFLFKTASYRDNEPADLLLELIAAHKRKVLVDLVIDYSTDEKELNEANLHAANALGKAGITVRLDSAGVTTHSKVFVIDDRYCFVGSHNITHAAMAMNQELSLFVDSPELGKRITEFVYRIPLSGELKGEE